MNSFFSFVLSCSSFFSFIAGAAIGCLSNYLTSDGGEYHYIWYAIALLFCSAALFGWAKYFKKVEFVLEKDGVDRDIIREAALKRVYVDSVVGKLILSFFALVEAALVVFFIVVLFQMALKTDRSSSFEETVQEKVVIAPDNPAFPNQDTLIMTP